MLTAVHITDINTITSLILDYIVPANVPKKKKNVLSIEGTPHKKG